MIKLQLGDILIEKANGMWGWSARFFFGRNYQHAAIVGFDDQYMYEDAWQGVIKSPIPFKHLDRYEVWRPNCSDDLKMTALFNIASRLGEGYGYIHLLSLWIRTRFGFDIDVDNNLICSELIAWGYLKAGYWLVHENDYDDNAPWDLRNPARLTKLNI